MIITGQYTSAEILTDDIENAALQWVMEQCDHLAFESVKIVDIKNRVQRLPILLMMHHV